MSESSVGIDQPADRQLGGGATPSQEPARRAAALASAALYPAWRHHFSLAFTLVACDSDDDPSNTTAPAGSDTTEPVGS